MCNNKMGLRDLVINEESKTSFLVSYKEGYEDPANLLRVQVHGPVKGQFVVTEHSFGSLGKSIVLDIYSDEQIAIQAAYLGARKFAEKHSIFARYEDRTSFKDSALKIA
jgi:hypothetical protein